MNPYPHQTTQNHQTLSLFQGSITFFKIKVVMHIFLTNKIAQYFSNLIIDCLLVVTNVLNNNDIEIKLFLPGQIFTFKDCYCKKRFFF